MTQQKTPAPIEHLLQWAYRDELPKRHCSSAEGMWNHIRENGQRGGMDVGEGTAQQRYPHYGLPHIDALVIEKAVSALPDAVINWEAEAELILGDAANILDIGVFAKRRPRDTKIGVYGTRSTVPGPREVIAVRTLRTSALVTMHAGMSTVPEWRSEPPEPSPIPSQGGRGVAIVGECRGHNYYSTGSYCPLRWSPSPLGIAEIRADYLAWWRGLSRLFATLTLNSHLVLPPLSPEMPWREAVPTVRVFVEPRGHMAKLPLGLARDTFAAPPRRQKGGPMRRLLTVK